MRRTASVVAALLAIACSAGFVHAQDPARSLSTSIYLPMVALPGGTFVMGNTGGAEGEPHERPAHEVEVAPFLIGTLEVTQAQFEAVMGYNPSLNPNPVHPVERVSWYDAVRFCNALSRMDGLASAYRIDPVEGYTLDPAANGYRLPTEAEWEYAAKAGTRTDTYAGDLDVQDGPSAVLNPIAWYYTDQAEGHIHPVRQKQPNAFGLYDIIGNVFEWVDADFAPYPGSRLAPDALSAAPDPRKVLRGGAMDTAPAYSRTSYRYRLHPSYTSYNVGFRVVRSAER